MVQAFQIIFNDSLKCFLPYNENTENNVIKQMKKPQNKRDYIYGIEFSSVKEVKVVDDKDGNVNEKHR